MEASRSRRAELIAPGPVLAAVALAATLAAAAIVLRAPGQARAAGAAHAAKPPLKAKIGIGDQKPEVFADARLRALKLGYARRSVAWDTLQFKQQTAELDAWLAGAEHAGMDPLISFSRSRRPLRRHRPPTARALGRAFTRFRKRYPRVWTFASWNEANHCGTGTCHEPGLVVSYYRTLRRLCPACTVLAADLNDHPDPFTWAKRFRHVLGYEPKYWGFHPYIDANSLTTRDTAQLLRAVSGQVWLTEVGGMVARRNGSSVRIPQGRARAALATRFIFDGLARLSPRIARIYLYHWSAATGSASWDSALIGPNGLPRPAFWVLRKVLRENGRLPQ